MFHDGIKLHHGCNENTIIGNVIVDSNEGIRIDDSDENSLIENSILNSSIGLVLDMSLDNEVSLNHFENNLLGYSLENSFGTKITQCNFINNSKDVTFMLEKFIPLQRWITLTRKFDNNYWDRWIGSGPMMFFGSIILWTWLFLLIPIAFPIPWILFDWNPAQEPYDIGIPWILFDWNPAQEPYDIGV